MDWGVYWFMFPACIVIAGTAIFSGISGAALLTPLFLIGFPLLGVPHLTTVQAIGTSLFLETSGFGMGVSRYLRLHLVDLPDARTLVAVTFPLGVLGAVLSYHVPSQALRLGYGIAMFGVAWLLGRGSEGRQAEMPCPCLVAHSDQSRLDCPDPQRREVQAATGRVYRFCIEGLGLQRLFSGFGALLAGLISTGVGEATLPTLVRRSHFPVPVAAATSTFVVAATVVGAATTHLIALAITGGLQAIPWNLIIWAVPGALIGAALGAHLQGKVSERPARTFFSALFLIIGVSFLLAFTVFRHRFA